MSANNPKDSPANEMFDLFGPPPLIRGEDVTRYWRLNAAVEDDIKPKDFFDKVRVRDTTDKLWERQRCKSSAAALVESFKIEALESLLRPFVPPPTMSFGEDAETVMARDYFSGHAGGKRLEEITCLLEIHGITPEQIHAKAMQLCGNAIAMFNRMEAHCEKSLRTLRKDNARRAADEDHAGDADEPNEV